MPRRGVGGGSTAKVSRSPSCVQQEGRRKAKMTRKDYRQLADELRITLKRIEGEEALEAFRLAVECMADAMKRNNARFDREKFAEAVFGRVSA